MRSLTQMIVGSPNDIGKQYYHVDIACLGLIRDMIFVSIDF